MGVKRLLDGGLSLDPEVASEVLGTNFTPQDPGHHIARTNNTWHVAGVVGPQTLRCGAEARKQRSCQETIESLTARCEPCGLFNRSSFAATWLQTHKPKQTSDPKRLFVACAFLRLA